MIDTEVSLDTCLPTTYTPRSLSASVYQQHTHLSTNNIHMISINLQVHTQIYVRVRRGARHSLTARIRLHSHSLGLILNSLHSHFFAYIPTHSEFRKRACCLLSVFGSKTIYLSSCVMHLLRDTSCMRPCGSGGVCEACCAVCVRHVAHHVS